MSGAVAASRAAGRWGTCARITRRRLIEAHRLGGLPVSSLAELLLLLW